MARFQLNIGDSSGQTYRLDIEEDAQTRALLGLKVKETFDAGVLGFDGYTFKITGGSDEEGFPMNPSVQGGMRKRILTAGGIGFHPTRKGLRRRKSVRGNTITEDIFQVNIKIVESGPKKIEELLAEIKTED